MRTEAANVAGRTAFARACAVAFVLGAPVVDIAAEQAGPPEAEARPLDLSIGRLNPFMAPADWFTPLPSDVDEVIVRGRRQPGEIPDRKAVPPGLGGLFWGVQNPSQSWRLLVPDPNASVPLRDADTPREPPGAYRSRIGEPGKIF